MGINSASKGIRMICTHHKIRNDVCTNEGCGKTFLSYGAVDIMLEENTFKKYKRSYLRGAIAGAANHCEHIRHIKSYAPKKRGNDLQKTQ